MLRAAPTVDTAPNQEIEQHPSALDPVTECLHAAAYTAAVDPARAIAQISDNYAGTQFESSVKTASSAIGLHEPGHAEFGSGRWYGQQLGGAVGMMVPFMLTRGRLRACMPSTFGRAAMTEAVQTSLLSFAAREAALSAGTGLAYGTFLRSSENTNGDNFELTRFKNGMSDLAVFGTMGFGTPLLGSALKGLGPIVPGIVSGVPAGVVGAEVNAWRQGRSFATVDELKESITSNVFVGGAFGGASWLSSPRMPAPERTHRAHSDRSPDLFAMLYNNHNVRALEAPPPVNGMATSSRLPGGDRVGDHVFGVTVTKPPFGRRIWTWDAAGITVYNTSAATRIIETKNGSRIHQVENRDSNGAFTKYTIEHASPADRITLHERPVHPQSNAVVIQNENSTVQLSGNVKLKLGEQESVAISFDTNERIIRSGGTRVIESIARPAYQSIYYTDKTSEHRYISGKRLIDGPERRIIRSPNHEQLLEHINIPSEPYDLMSDRTANIERVNRTTRAIRLTDGKEVTETAVREYTLVGIETPIVVPEVYARELDAVRQARQRGELDLIPPDKARTILPEHFADILPQLPDSRLVNEIHMLSGVKGTEAIAGRDGIIRVYSAGARADNWFPSYAVNGALHESRGHKATLAQHEWSHLLDDWFANTAFFDNAMRSEAVPYYARDYARTNRHENIGVHMGEKFLHPDGDHFLHFAMLAPMRTIAFSQMLQKLRAQNGNLGAHDAQLGQRIEYVEQNLIPPLQPRMNRLSRDSSVPDQQQSSRERFLRTLIAERAALRPLTSPQQPGSVF